MPNDQYKEYLASLTWKTIRERVIEERKGKCERCGSKYRLEVHHKEYPKVLGTEPTSSLELLCHKCHISHHVQTAPAIKVKTGWQEMKRWQEFMKEQSKIKGMEAKKKNRKLKREARKRVREEAKGQSK
jgi:hypothetical protein